MARAAGAGVFGLLLAGSLLMGAPPASACFPQVTMSGVDAALASTRLKALQLADANALRDDMAEAVQRNDQARAHHLEAQVMQLMGYVEERPASRSAGCTRNWIKKNG